MKKRAWILFFLPLVLAAAEKDVRPFLQTGPWYPSDPVQLRRMLDGFFAPLPPPAPGTAVRGIVAPHAGYEYSGRCAARAYRALSPGQGIRRVILMGASHRRAFRGAVVDDHSTWSTPLGVVEVDVEACRTLAGRRLFQRDRDAVRFEHSLENQLPFLQRALGDSGYRLVPIVFGTLAKGEFAAIADALAPLVDDHTLLVASSDLTHFGESFGYVPFRRDLAANLDKLDQGFIAPILRLDFDRYFAYRERTGITACGFVPIGVMMRLLAGRDVRGELVDYYKSGDLSGDYTTSVSYAAILFSEMAPCNGVGLLDERERQLLLELARSTLRDRFQKREAASDLPARFASRPRLTQQAGVFVTLRRRGELRGCIGSIVGAAPLWSGVAANALYAAFDDPRFPPLQERELAGIAIEISVMTPLQPLDDYRAVRLRTDGVVIRDGQAQAVFLPQVATETGWNLDQFLGQLCLKAGLERDAYRTSRSLRFYVFQAQVFAEGEPGR